MIFETKRLFLRKMTQDDFIPLCKILQDPDVMYAYEHAFSDEEVHHWINRQLQRYEKDGFGLWLVVLKENNEIIGQCGLTIQDFNGRDVVEIGYLFAQAYWHQGFATEAALACREYAFNTLKIDEVFSIIRDSNIASQKVALRNGMSKVGGSTKHYYNIDMPHFVYSIKSTPPYFV